MFGNMERERETFRVEALSPSYLIRANVQPLGALLTYFNDRRRDYVSFRQVELHSLSASRQMRGVTRELMSVNKPSLALLSLLVADEAQRVQLIASKRPVVFYLGAFVVRGQLHVNLDANDEDLLDDARDFFPVSEAAVFPLETVSVRPTAQVPLLFVNRPHVQAYHIHQE